MSEFVDDLSIQIEAEATKAVSELDKLTEKLGDVGGKLTEIAKNPLKIDLTVSGGATKQVDKLAQYADKVAKDMSKHFQEAFNIPNSSMAGVKNLTKQFVDMGITGREGTAKAMSAVESGDIDLANELIKAAAAGQEADAVMKSFYDTVKSISKIYISPDMIPTDTWKSGMDGLLRQKFTTQKDSDAISLDSLFEEWNEEFPSLFGSLDTHTEQDQFEALTQVVKECRAEIERPLQTQSRDFEGGVWEDLIEQADALAKKGENAKAVLNDLNIPTVSTENTGFSDLASSLSKIGKVNAENLASVGQAVKQMAEGLQSLNGVTFNIAPFEQLAYVAEKLNKIPTVSTATLENITSIGQALKGLSGVQLDGIGGVTADLAELSKGLRDLGKNPVDGLEQIRNAAKPLSEVRAELDEQFKDLGKDWDFTGNIQTKIQSLQNSLAEATSKAQALEASGKFNGKGYADAVRQINEYTNKIAVLEEKIKPLNDGALNPDVQIHFNDSGTTRSIEDFEATYNELKTLLEDGYSVKPAIVNTINELIDELPEADAEINKFKDLLAQANEAAQGNDTGPKFQFDASQFEQASSAVDDFEQRLESIKPMDFSGSMFELEKFVADLNAKRAQLEQKSSDLDILGVGVDTQRVQSVQIALERINKTLEIYEEKLNAARAAGELDIKIAPLDTGALDEAENKIVGFGEIFRKITIPTEQFYEIQEEMDAVKEKYNALADTINSRAQDTQFYGTTKDYANKMAELESLRQEYQALKAEQDALENGSISDNVSTVFGKIGTACNAVSGAMETFKQKLSAVQGTLKKFESFCSKVVSAVKKFGSAVKKIILPTNNAKKSVDKFSLSNAGLAKALTKTVKMLKLMVVRMALRSVIDGVKTGFQNLAQYSETVNADLSLLMNSLNQLKNSFAAMVAPILNVVTPALDFLIQKLITVTNYINQLFSALTGSSTWTKASVLADDYAESVSDAASSTDAATKSLQGFDELNNITTSSGSGSSSGTDASDMFTTEEVESGIADWAESIREAFANGDWYGIGQIIADGLNTALQTVDDWINNVLRPKGVEWAANIAELLNGLVDGFDWTLLGKTIADGLNAVADILNTFLTTFNFENLGIGIGTAINGLFDNVEWNLLGETFANCWNALIDTIYGIVETTDWSGIGSSLGTYLNNFFKTLDLEKAAESLATTINGIIDALWEFLVTSNWNMYATKFANSINTFFEEVDWSEVGETLVTGFKKAIKALDTFIKEVDWKEIATDLVECLQSAVETADFPGSETVTNLLDKLQEWIDGQTATDLAEDIEKLAVAFIALEVAVPALEGVASVIQILSTVGAGLSTVGAGITKVAGALGTATGLSAAWTSLGGLSGILTTDLGVIAGAGTAAEIGLTIGTGILGGVAAAAGGFALGEWINEKITGEKIDMSWAEQFSTIKESFSDGSWKGALELWGQDINDGLIAVAEAEDEFVQGIKEKFSEAWGNIKADASEAWESIKSNLSEKWENIKSDASEKFENVKTNVSEAWENIKSDASEKWETIKTSLSETWESVKETAGEKFDTLKENLSTTWENLTEDTSEKWETIKESLSETWETVKEDASEKFENIKENIGEKWETVKEDTSEKWGNIKENLAEKWDDIKSDASTKFGDIKANISDTWDNVKSSTSDTWDDIKGVIKDAINGIIGSINGLIDSAVGGVNNVIDALNGLSFDIPDWVPALGGKSFSLSIPKVTAPQIPYLESGGYVPASADLFWANENGIPELVGTMGGRTAVASGTEITGISDAVYSTGQTEAALLQTAISLLNTIASKEYGISSSDLYKSVRKSDKEYANRTGSSGFAY